MNAKRMNGFYYQKIGLLYKVIYKYNTKIFKAEAKTLEEAIVEIVNEIMRAKNV